MNNEIMTGEKMNRFSKDEFCVWSEAEDISLESDINEEYILPDYLPDIRKILLVKTNVKDSETELFDGRIEQSGKIEFKIVYSSDEGQIKCVNLTYSFDGKAYSENVYDDSVMNEKVSVVNRTVRAVSQRKFAIKARVITEIKVFNKLCVQPRMIGGSGIEDEFTLERKINALDCINFVKFNESDVRVSRDIQLQGNEQPLEIVYYNVDIFDDGTVYSNDKCEIKCIAKLCCMYSFDAGDGKIGYSVIERNIPIMQTVERKLPRGEWVLYPKMNVNAVECAIANDSMGEMRMLELDFSFDADVFGFGNQRTEFTDDVYSTKYGYENKYRTVTTRKLTDHLKTNFSISGEYEIKNSENKPKEILDFSAYAEIISVNTKDGKAELSGNTNVKAVMKSENGEYSTEEFVIPWKYTCKYNGDGEVIYSGDANVIEIKLKTDGEKIYANSEIGLDVGLFENVSVKSVENITIDKSAVSVESKERETILYYPEKNELLWDIAKKYGISPELIIKANKFDLSGEMPKVIVIPA